MVADFYEVDTKIIQQTYKRNQAEIDADGAFVTTSKDIRQKLQNEVIVKKPNDYTLFVRLESGEDTPIYPKTTYFSPRAVLRIGMLLRDSEVAKEVRTQLLIDRDEKKFALLFI